MTIKTTAWAALLVMACLNSIGDAGDAVGSRPDGGFLQNGVTAHRGNSFEYPENTLPAFQSAIELGADWIELDIFRTRDGQLIVSHDATTGRVGNRDAVVKATDTANLREIDVATGFRQHTKQTINDVPVQSMPLLEEVLQLVMQQSRTRVSIQPKMDCVVEAVELVRDLGAEDWVGFNDGNLAYMTQVKQLAPNIPVFWDRGPGDDIDESIRIAKKRGFESLVLHDSLVTAESIQAIQNAGLRVGAWTVNDPERLKTLLDWKIDRVYTDRPRLLLALQKEQQQEEPKYHAVQCEGWYKYHLQGVCVDDESIYWSFTTKLVKTDLHGRKVKAIDVAWHHGDLCHHNGRLYVAVNLGKFNDPEGNADSWVYVYDAATLKELARHETQEVFHGAGGIGFHDGHFYVVGGLPADIEENYVYEYSPDFEFIKKHVVKSGQTLLGIQTAAFAHGKWWFGCYGKPAELLVTDAEFNMQGRHEFNCSLGVVGLPDGRLYVAHGRCIKEKGCAGGLRLARPDKETGLQIVKEE